MARILQLTLKKKWFDLIMIGEKTIEYREIKPYWERRLDEKTFDMVFFKNGYSKASRKMLFECLNIIKNKETGFYEIYLGRKSNLSQY